jgi:hypothetical protein
MAPFFLRNRIQDFWMASTLRCGWSSVNVVQITDVGSNTYTPPANLLFAFVVCIGGGGSGGSGRKGAMGVNRRGGGAGSQGAMARKIVALSEMGGPVTVTVGAAGVGGAAQTVDSTNGNAGTGGGSTSFGALVIADGGNGGDGGTSTAAAGGNGRSADTQTPAIHRLSIGSGGGGSGGSTAGSISTSLNHVFMGGGGGGGINTANTQANGATGSRITTDAGPLSAVVVAGAGNGVTHAGNGLDNQWIGVGLESVPANTIGVGTSGGGGAGNRQFIAGESTDGGYGGLYGGAGGGGGAGEDSTGLDADSGKGGDGAQGCCIIFEYLK